MENDTGVINGVNGDFTNTNTNINEGTWQNIDNVSGRRGMKDSKILIDHLEYKDPRPDHDNVYKLEVSDSLSRESIDKLISNDKSSQQCINSLNNRINSVDSQINTLYTLVNTQVNNISSLTAKVNEISEYLYGEGGDSGDSEIPTPDGHQHKIYYGELSEKINKQSDLENIQINNTGNFYIKNVDCNNTYFYILCENTKSLVSVITENYENITSDFIQLQDIYQETVDDQLVQYKIYEFFAEIPLNAKISFNIQ